MFHKPQGLVVPTYQHIFWGSFIAKTLWAYADHVNGFTYSCRVTLHLSKYQDVYREIESADLSDEA